MKNSHTEMLKISKKELDGLIKEEVVRQEKKQKLLAKIDILKENIKRIDEIGEMQPYAAQPTNGAVTSNEKTESIFDAKPGETVVFNFQDVTIKVQRQLDDLFKVVDAMESKKLNDGDYIKIQGNDTLQKGKKFKFIILRESLKYESNPLVSWKVIKNR